MSDNATWTVWGGPDPAEDPMPLVSDVTREVAAEQVDVLHAQGHTKAYAVDTAANADSGVNDDDEPDDRGTFYDGPTVTVDGFESLLNLPSVRKFRTGEDGTLVAIDYRHDTIYPQLSGPELHFQLPDGRTVVTVSDGQGSFDLAWKDGPLANGEVDEGAHEVLHMMRGEIAAAFDRLTRQFLAAAVTNVGQALTATTPRSAS